MQTKGVEIVCAAHHTGVSHMEQVSHWTVERRDWSKPDGQRTTLLGTFTDRKAAHACASAARSGCEDPTTCGKTENCDVWRCDPCQARLEARYPQGWRHYPGDTCKHGVYVGGCGVDWMCGVCESE